MLPFLLAAAAAAPAAAATDDFTRGRELRLSGRPAEAAAYLERAAQAHPNDADIWLNLGLARAAAGAFDAADQALARAAALAPDYVDVDVARARVAFFRGDLAEARRRLAPAEQRAPDNPEVRALAAQLAAAKAQTAPWRVDANYANAWLSKGLPGATDATAALSRRLAGGTVLGGSVERVRQFGQTDTYLELQAARSFGYLAVGGTPNATFRPRWAVRGGLTARPRPIGAGWSVQLALDLGWARYPVGDVRAINPSLTLARGERLSLQGRWINVVDETNRYRSGYAVRGVWRVAGPLKLDAGWSEAPESDVGVTVNVRAATAGVALDVAGATTLRLGFTHEIRPAYDRDELAVGLTRRF